MAFQYYKKSADQGHSTAAYLLGAFCFQGSFGIENEKELAFQYLKFAADSGHAPAYYFVGTMYAEGTKIPPFPSLPLHQNRCRHFNFPPETTNPNLPLDFWP